MICAALLLSGAAFAQGATGGSLGNDNKTLSGSSPEPRSAAPARRERSERRARRSQAAPRDRGDSVGSGGKFDGVWSISSAGTSGCSDTLTEEFVVTNGRMMGRNGSGSAAVSANGAVSGSGNYSGIRVTSQGRLSGRAGSGSFQRSDGCAGRWVATRQ
ncbi:hypothetical protein ONR75_03460 [Rhodopseudomonas sp. P2A-2r]|uniref:hypothetical protein n=1 Tax=Rhodopseudomonas sp. P2A-2r TaxID=2991972 RepID=UPI002234547B|nr:hypothetical protein [Rhodopseudomonas sp. P2A-2r]UZE49863.1 hypothetical protein ONR75_03460 [Rhodopseudomonas sp. P2A-2r]